MNGVIVVIVVGLIAFIIGCIVTLAVINNEFDKIADEEWDMRDARKLNECIRDIEYAYAEKTRRAKRIDFDITGK